MESTIFAVKPETNVCVKHHSEVHNFPPATWTSREDEPSLIVCSHCGSITPNLALALMKETGVHFSAADWKYGWPHKFYFEFPNPNADLRVRLGGRSGPKIDGTHADDEWMCNAHYRKPNCGCPRERGVTGYWSRVNWGTRATLHKKFYNEHLADLSDADFEEFSKLSMALFLVTWQRDADLRIRWAAKHSASRFYGVIGDGGKPDHSSMTR